MEELDPPAVDAAVAVGGTATSLHRLVGPRLTRERWRPASPGCAPSLPRRPLASWTSTPSASGCCPPASRCSAAWPHGWGARCGCAGRRARGRHPRAGGRGRGRLMAGPISGAAPAAPAPRTEEHLELAAVLSRQPALLHPHLGAGHVVHRQREVGVVAHQQHVVAAPLGHLARVERAALQARVRLGLDAERLAGQRGGLAGAYLGAGDARVHAHPDLRQRPAGGLRLPAALARSAGARSPGSRPRPRRGATSRSRRANIEE